MSGIADSLIKKAAAVQDGTTIKDWNDIMASNVTNRAIITKFMRNGF
jgi:hypothetical protein